MLARSARTPGLAGYCFWGSFPPELLMTSLPSLTSCSSWVLENVSGTQAWSQKLPSSGVRGTLRHSVQPSWKLLTRGRFAGLSGEDAVGLVT